MTAKSVAEVLSGVRRPIVARCIGDDSALVVDVTLDSREVHTGWWFACVRGEHRDGHDFAQAAVDAGATALLVERVLQIESPEPVCQVVVDDCRAALGWIASSMHGHPCDSLLMIGVTGTNGKTTTVQLTSTVLRAAGHTVEVIGTLTGKHTTPEATDLQRRLAMWRDAGVTAVAMEVSSHALALHRVDGAHFDAATFTNLGRDHLDLHGTVERYFAAKAELFRSGRSALGVVNVDDVHGRLLMDAGEIPMTGFSIADVEDLDVTASRHTYRWHGLTIDVAMGGAFNAMNSLAAAATAAAVGIDPTVIQRALAEAGPVPGRFEPIVEGQDFAVVVDYAHTPDGLREALGAARSAIGGGRVIVVFGCGGDRDREKRPEMGATAARLADVVVVTSDNPRSEDPMDIVNATVEGVPEDYRSSVVIEPDRRTAIAVALGHARQGDVVVVAGKGHETTQTIGDLVLDFDDRAVVRELLAEIGGTRP